MRLYDDHLGNTRVTYRPNFNFGVLEYDIKGVFDYFPYGKMLRTYEAENEKYLTTQHQRDIETGFDYRGARFYDSDVARFLSVDPLAVKYPTLSDYVYVADNPLIYVDPDGKELIIHTEDNAFREYIFTQLQELTQDKLTMDETGKISISSSSQKPNNYGTTLVEQLVSSDNKHFIIKAINGDNHSKPLVGGSDNAENGTGTGTTITIDPVEGVVVMDEDGVYREMDGTVVLAHELIHSSHADKGNQEPDLAPSDGDNYPVQGGFGVPQTKEEIKTRKKENIIRKEQGVKKLRKVAGPNTTVQIEETIIKPPKRK